MLRCGSFTGRPRRPTSPAGSSAGPSPPARRPARPSPGRSAAWPPRRGYFDLLFLERKSRQKELLYSLSSRVLAQNFRTVTGGGSATERAQRNDERRRRIGI